ncbi:MAG: antitoxin VapB family protein [Nitrososphaera sp.]
MPRKSIHISEEAYQAIKGLRKRNESISDTILRLASKRSNARQLLEAMDNGKFYSPELADRVEEASLEFRKNFRLRDVRF